MSYHLRIEKKGDVLWVTATGARSLETVLAMARDILAACAENKVAKVLTDVRALEGRLASMESYEVVTQHFPEIRDRHVITHNAIVDLKEFAGSYRFFEDLAANRGYALRIFSNPDAAIEWLRK